MLQEHSWLSNPDITSMVNWVYSFNLSTVCFPFLATVKWASVRAFLLCMVDQGWQFSKSGMELFSRNCKKKSLTITKFKKAIFFLPSTFLLSTNTHIYTLTELFMFIYYLWIGGSLIYIVFVPIIISPPPPAITLRKSFCLNPPWWVLPLSYFIAWSLAW